MKNTLPRIAYRQNEAAQVLGVSDRTLRDWMASDDPPPSFRRANTLLFPHDGLIEWMRRQSEPDKVCAATGNQLHSASCD